MGPCILYRTCIAACLHEENTFKEDCSWDSGHCCFQTFGTCIWLYAERVALITQNENLGKILAHGYYFLEVDVAYYARNEYCEIAVDFIARRSRLAFLDTDATRRALLCVIEILATEHGWDKARKKSEMENAKYFLETFKSSQNAQFDD